MSINPMAAIIALILGSELWGTPGMILSMPAGGRAQSGVRCQQDH
ncbi:MAG: hypothetical protein WKG07_48595 [Hymenobacter sp.]